MLDINISTILLQMANFFILVFVLYRFLFKPLQNTMKKREDEINRTLDEAEKAKQAAEAAQKLYEEKTNNIDAEITARKNEARIVIEQTRQQMLHEVEKQVELLKAQTEETLGKLRSEAVQQHKDEIGDLVADYAKGVMKNIMNPQIQAEFQEEFLTQIQNIDLSVYVEGSGPGEVEYIKVIMASPPTAEFKDRLAAILNQTITHEFNLTFEVDPNLIAGGLLRFENELIDGSLGGQINKFRKQYQEQV